MKRLAGAHLWAQWHPHPMGFSLWKYEGTQEQNGALLHRFKRHESDKKEAYSFLLLPAASLNHGSNFRPFLIDTGEIPHGA